MLSYMFTHTHNTPAVAVSGTFELLDVCTFSSIVFC